jgi:hypothetical protein
MRYDEGLARSLAHSQHVPKDRTVSSVRPISGESLFFGGQAGVSYRLLVWYLFTRTPKVTFISLKAILDANALLTLLIYTRHTQQSAQSFRPCISGKFDI